MAENENGNDNPVVVPPAGTPKPPSVVAVASQLETDDLIAARLFKQQKTFKATKDAISKRRNEIKENISAFNKRARELADAAALAVVEASFDDLRTAFKHFDAELIFEVDCENWTHDEDDECSARLVVLEKRGKKDRTQIFVRHQEMTRPPEATKLLEEVEKLRAFEHELQKTLEDVLKNYGDIHTRRDEARIALLRWKGNQEGGEEIRSIVEEMNADTPEETEQAKSLQDILAKPLPALASPQ
jgi:uncharacterized coiled-coil DUF342 family protein